MSWAEVMKIEYDFKKMFYLYGSDNIIYSSGAVSVRGTGTTDAINKVMKYPGALQIQAIVSYQDADSFFSSTIKVYVNEKVVASKTIELFGTYGLSASFNKGDTLRVTVSKRTNNPIGSPVTINLLGQVGIGGAIFDE